MITDAHGNVHTPAGTPTAGRFAGHARTPPRLDLADAGLELPTDAQFAEFGKRVAAMLGSAREWDDDGYLEDFGTHAKEQLGIPVGDQDESQLKLWRSLADEVGVYYEADDDDDDGGGDDA